MGLQYKSIVEPVIERAKCEPDRPAMIFIANDGSRETITTGSIHREASEFSRALYESGVRPGDVVIIALGHSKDLIIAFWGILYSGAIPSIFPSPFPKPSPVAFKKQIRSIVHRSGARTVVSNAENKTDIVDSINDSGCTVLDIHAFQALKPGNNRISLMGLSAEAEQIAYLQFTSGTMGLQKGVLLSHRAVLNFVSAFQNALDMTSEDVIVNWTPLYHDGGLFVGLVMPMALGILTVLMSPFKWVRSPKTFLWAIHEYRGTLCWMPNSAFHHAVRGVHKKDLEGLDLSSVRVLINSGEPVIYDSQKMFLDYFSPYGFKETALAAGYGLAENTLAVTITRPGKRPPLDFINKPGLQKNRLALPGDPEDWRSSAIVGCGIPLQGVEIAVVDENNRWLPDRHAGEIIVRGEFLFSGYHRNRAQTARSMHNSWFHTGDVGYRIEKQLFVCGRKKDLIIMGGRNIHPEDLETIVNTIPGIYPDRSVAFGVEDEQTGSERIVMVVGLLKSVNSAEKVNIERDFRSRVFQELDIHISKVHLLKKGWVVKTPNGKISRHATRQKYIREIMKGKEA